MTDFINTIIAWVQGVPVDSPRSVFILLRACYESFPSNVKWLIGVAFGGLLLVGLMRSFGK